MPMLPPVQRVQIPNFAETILGAREARRRNALDERRVDIAERGLGIQEEELGIRRLESVNKIADTRLKNLKQIDEKEKEKIDTAVALFGKANSAESFKLAGQLFLKRYPDERQFLNSLFPDNKFRPEVADSFKRMLMTAQQIASEGEIKGFSPGSTLYRDGKQIGQVPFKPDKPDKPSTLGQLIGEWEESTGQTLSPQQKGELYSRWINKQTTLSKGSRIQVGADGQVTIEEGGQEPQGGIRQAPGLGIPATNIMQKDLLDATRGLTRLAQIQNTFDRNFTTIPGKFRAGVLNLKDKLNVELTAEESKFLREQSTFAQNVTENINLYIKEITGAQMSEAEANRLRKAVADIGDSFLAGDGPIRFQAKVANQVKKLKMATARLHWANLGGLEIARIKEAPPNAPPGRRVGDITAIFDKSGNTIELEDMPDIINKRANEIGYELEAAGISEAEAKKAALKRVSVEFGFVLPKGN